MTYIEPKAFESKFTCPHCGAISRQQWDAFNWNLRRSEARATNPLRIATCDHCADHSLWLNDVMIHPDKGIAPGPNPDLPDSVKSFYLEAASISAKSPRGAAALLRLGIQVFCKELGESGDNINDDIANLVKKDLPKRVQQALDIVRVTGNNAVHPGQIDVDDPTVVAKLFGLLNVIAEYMVSMPQRVDGLYSSLPQGNLDQIKKRDGG